MQGEPGAQGSFLGMIRENLIHPDHPLRGITTAITLSWPSLWRVSSGLAAITSRAGQLLKPPGPSMGRSLLACGYLTTAILT